MAKNKIGRYEIIGEIGQGRMGVVYKAQDPIIDRTVALKMVHIEALPRSDVLRRRLQSEAKLAGKLHHPGIVTIYDAGEDERGDSFIVMEYVEGPLLAELMASGVSSEQAIDIGLQLCDALDYAHKQGMVHGDLKPSNIKVCGDLKVRITDFGLARSIQASTTEGFAGTLAYAPPEQLRGDQIDGRSDVFSLGIILFEMLTGIRPFNDNDLERCEPVRDWLNRIPSSFLQNVLLKALARDVDQRYGTCADLGKDLKRYRDGDPSIVTENPFIWGPPIVRPQDFYGRHWEIQTVVSRLKSVAPMSSAIIGERRIGKTSLLRILGDPYVVRKRGFTQEYIFVPLYFRKTSEPLEVETQLWRLILRGMREQMAPWLPATTVPVPMIDQILSHEHITFNDFKEVVTVTREAGLKFVLLFDEFENVVGNEAFQPSIFGGLRDLIQNYNLAFVTASGKNLQDLSRREEVASSPLWNVFANVYLGPFNEGEAHELVTGYTHRTDISFTTEDFDYVMHVSGGHPYFLQLACSCVFDSYRAGKWGRGIAPEKAKQSSEEKLYGQVKSHFAYFWEQSTEGEKQVLITLAYQGQRSGDRDRQHLKSLGERSLIIKTGTDDYKIFSPLFAGWIRQHVEDNYDKELEPCLRYFWDQAEKDERRALVILARRSQRQGITRLQTAIQYSRLIAQPNPNLNALRERGLVIQTNNQDHEIFTPLFSRWILSQQGNIGDKLALAYREAQSWLRKVGIALAVILFVTSAILVWPDLPALKMKVLNLDEVTSIEDLKDGSGNNVRVKVYNPPLLFVGETGNVEIQTYGLEKPKLEVVPRRKSSDVVIADKKDVFEIKCKGTNANWLSQSEPIELDINATMPGGGTSTVPVTVKTNYFLSMLLRVGVLLTSGMTIGGLSLKKLDFRELWQWFRIRRERGSGSTGEQGTS